MRKLAVLVLLVSAGCASAPIKKTDAASLVVADTRLLEGCYTCLLEARDVYTRVAVGKARPLVIARQVGMYVFREITDFSYPAIAKEFGGRDHTTVLHAVRKISAERQNVTELNQQLHVLEQTLKG